MYSRNIFKTNAFKEYHHDLNDIKMKKRWYLDVAIDCECLENDFLSVIKIKELATWLEKVG